MKNWNINFCGHRKLYFFISAVLIAVMLIGAVVFGVGLDIQFRGGALITYSYTGTLDQAAFKAAVESVLGESVNLQESVDAITGKNNLVVSLAAADGISMDKQTELTAAVEEQFAANEIETVEINVVNPTIGAEFLQKSLLTVAFASLIMVIYISFRFKKISGWSAGITAVCALLHDILMVFAVFVLFRISLNANFIAVCLTILGYSLNDTIVVYDRIRENKRLYDNGLSTEELVNMSLNQSFTRSLMTSVTTATAMVVVTVVALVANVESILSFSFPMIIGMLSGFYSSVCIAPNLWVMWQNRRAAKA